MARQRIRIRLKAFDHKILDQSAQLRWDALASAGCSVYPRLFHHVVRECERYPS